MPNTSRVARHPRISRVPASTRGIENTATGWPSSSTTSKGSPIGSTATIRWRGLSMGRLIRHCTSARGSTSASGSSST